jgi:hypothetical protein
VDVSLPQAVASNGNEHYLVSSLSRAAEEEHHVGTALLESVVLLSEEDTRHSPFLDGNGRLRTVPLYKTLSAIEPSSYNFFKFVQKKHAPPRVHFFIWIIFSCSNVLTAKQSQEHRPGPSV